MQIRREKHAGDTIEESTVGRGGGVCTSPKLNEISCWLNRNYPRASYNHGSSATTAATISGFHCVTVAIIVAKIPVCNLYAERSGEREKGSFLGAYCTHM